jgi:hypothetical protein
MFPTRSNLRKSMAKLLMASCVTGGLIATERVAVWGQDKPVQLMTWTDSTGKIKTEAEFIKLEGVKLHLRKADGKEVMVTLNRLDDKSRLRARSIAKRGLSGGEAGPVPVLGPPVEFPSNPSAAEFKDIVLGELKKNNFIVLWDALPASKQQQVEELVKLAAGKVEQKTLDLIKKFRSDLFSTLRSKKEFLFKSKALPIPPDELSQLEVAYEPLVEMLEFMLPEDLLDAKNLQDSELRNLANNYLVNFVTKSNAVEQLVPKDGSLKIASAQMPDDIKIESLSAKEALLHPPVPEGMPQPKPIKFVLVEGRWLPEDMMLHWDKSMAQAKMAIESADPKVIHRSVGQAMFGLTALMGAFSLAETQEDFDEAIQQVINAAGAIPGMSMPGPGGPAGTQPTNPGAPPQTNRKKMPTAPG